MDRHAEFGYAQARLQAHHAARPDESAWRRIESIGELATFLQDARTGSLRPWVLGLSADVDAHVLEFTLRQQLRAYIDAVASWQPVRWRAALRWTRILPDLPLLQHLLSGGLPPDWLRHDPLFGPAHRDDGSIHWEVLQTIGYMPLLTAWQQGIPLAQAWTEHWHTLWPDTPAPVRAALAALVAVLADYMQALVIDDVAHGVTARDVLALRLTRLFRRYTNQPAAGCSHLALVALDVQRLRGAVLRRKLLPMLTEHVS